MATPVEEFAAFNITKAMAEAKREFEEWGQDCEEYVEVDGEPLLSVRGWWRIILHEEKRIAALKRQINRLIQGNTIESDDVLYPDEELST